MAGMMAAVRSSGVENQFYGATTTFTPIQIITKMIVLQVKPYHVMIVS